MNDKHELRKQILALKKDFRKTHTIEQQRELSELLLAKIEVLPLFVEARTVLAYHSLPDEVFTHSFVERWAKEKNILLPKVVGDNLTLRKYEARDSLQKGAFGIEEPSGAEFTSYSDIDLVIVPGVAFDLAGNRLGRGKGYYDKLFANILPADVVRVGVCFPFQVLPAIPTESTDVQMNILVHEP